MKKPSLIAVLALILIVSGLFASSVFAHHPWANYHWPRTTTAPVALKFGSNVPLEWERYLKRAVTDWSKSHVLDGVVVPGKANPLTCKSSYGRVEVCVAEYGETGWLGIVHIWVSDGRIQHGVVKINDTYFKTDRFNKTEGKYQIMCHEIGHVLGLGHQDTDQWNAPLGTCMDYSEDVMPNQRPNAHDYEELERIYANLDSISATSSRTVIITSPGIEK